MDSGKAANIFLYSDQGTVNEKTGQHFGPCEKDNELRRFTAREQRKRFKNAVFGRRFTRLDLGKKCPHGLGKRQIPLAMHGCAIKFGVMVIVLYESMEPE